MHVAFSYAGAKITTPRWFKVLFGAVQKMEMGNGKWIHYCTLESKKLSKTHWAYQAKTHWLMCKIYPFTFRYLFYCNLKKPKFVLIKHHVRKVKVPRNFDALNAIILTRRTKSVETTMRMGNNNRLTVSTRLCTVGLSFVSTTDFIRTCRNVEDLTQKSKW